MLSLSLMFGFFVDFGLEIFNVLVDLSESQVGNQCSVMIDVGEIAILNILRLILLLLFFEEQIVNLNIFIVLKVFIRLFCLLCIVYRCSASVSWVYYFLIHFCILLANLVAIHEVMVLAKVAVVQIINNTVKTTILIAFQFHEFIVQISFYFTNLINRFFVLIRVKHVKKGTYVALLVMVSQVLQETSISHISGTFN